MLCLNITALPFWHSMFQGNSPQARAVAANLSQKLHQLKGKMSEALVNQVADDFVDIASPLKQMSDAALAPLGKA